jgi:ABC-type nickel/cobalt efflux system permease component RcnA
MLRTIFFLGIALIVGGVVLGLVFGLAMAVLGIAIKVAVVGAIAYLIIRVISPDTAAMIRSQCQRKSFNRF